MASAFLTAKVVENYQWAENLFSLKLAIQLAPFKAGQFIRLQLMINGEKAAKPYSLVSTSKSKYAEVFYNVVKDGEMSNALSKLQRDDVIEISESAAGFFILDELPKAKQLWMMATGTGLGPYLSILQEETVWQRFEHIVLVHAVSYENNLAYRDMIHDLQNKHNNQLSYVPIVSREDSLNSLKGRIPKLLNNGQLEDKVGLVISSKDSHVMLCGNQNMITDTRAALSKRGLQKHLRRKPGHITTEHYF